MEIQTHRNCDIRGSMCSALKRPLQCAVQFLYLRICVSPQRPAIDPSNPERGFIQQNARLATAPSHWKIWNCTLRYCGVPKNVSPHHGGGARNPESGPIHYSTDYFFSCFRTPSFLPCFFQRLCSVSTSVGSPSKYSKRSKFRAPQMGMEYQGILF